MAEQNPIKYSDLISPDDSITTLISQLEQLNEAYTGMATSVRAQAASVAQSLRNVSGATAQGQQATRNAAQDADKLRKAYEELNFARSETARKIKELQMAKQEENRITKLQILLNNSEEGSYAHLSAQYSLNKMQLNQLTAAERENLPHAKKLEEETRKIYEEMKRLQEATGKYSLNVGNYTNSITQAIGVNTRWYQGLQEIATLTEGGLANGIKAAGSAVGAFGKQLLALMANPIVLTITAIAAAFAALAKGISTSEQNTNALNRILAPFQRILTEVLDVIQGIATRILKVVEGFENLAMGASRLIEKLPLVGAAMKKVNDALQENIDLERERQALKNQERANTVENAKLERDIALLKNIAASTKDVQMKEMALRNARRKEEQILKNNIDYAKRIVVEKEREVAQNQSDTKALDELAQARANVSRAETAYLNHTLRLNKQLNNLKKDGASGGGGGGKSGKDTTEDLAKQQLAEQRKIEDARIELIEDSLLKERFLIVTSYQRKIEDLQGSEEYILQMTEYLEKQKQQKLAALAEKEAQQQRDAEKKDLDARLKATDDMMKKREQAVRAGEQAINQEYELAMSYTELEESEQKKTEMRLKAEKERLQKLLKLYEADGRTLTDTEVQILKNNIAQVDKEMEKAKKGRDIYDMLGLNLSDEKKEAINESFSYAMDQLSQYLDAWVQAAEKKAQMAEQEVERTKSNLDKEIEARNNGYAANVELARKEMEEAKKNQRKALQEQERAQKAQQALQTIQQASNLITATTMIWSQLGFPWALPAIAVMWGSFAAAKIKAAEVTSNTEQYGEGTVELLEGGSHQSGNDIDLGRKKDGTRRRAEGGEYFAVINKRNSRRFRSIIPSVINSLNDGTFAQKYQRAYGDGGVAVSVQQAPDIRELSNDVRLIREQGETSSTFDANGNEIVRYKNLRRIIKN